MTQSDLLTAIEPRLHELLRAGIKGDGAAYKSFFDEMNRHLRAFLRRRLSGAEDEIEDVLQEVLLAIHLARHRYRDGQPVTAWAYGIARHKLIDHFRARARRRTLIEAHSGPVEDLNAAPDESIETLCDLGYFLRQLPDRYRLPILHVKLRGLSVKETAVLTSLSESAVKVGIHRGLGRLMGVVHGQLTTAI